MIHCCFRVSRGKQTARLCYFASLFCLLSLLLAYSPYELILRNKPRGCQVNIPTSCCEDIRMNAPYFYTDWLRVLNILEALDRPWFASGGWGLFALRVGGFGFNVAPPEGPKKEWGGRFGMDVDMDVTIIFNDAEDQAAKYVEITALCERVGGLICARNKPNNGTATLWDSTNTFYFSLWGGWINEAEDVVSITEIAGYTYNLPMSRVLPLKYAQFHGSRIRVANDYMWVYSHLRPWSERNPPNESLDGREVEYGQGCMKMAFPSFLQQSFGIPAHRPINSSLDDYESVRRLERGLVDCAFCLEAHGCASFAECFRVD